MQLKLVLVIGHCKFTWAIRSTYHTVLGATPGQLAFGRDMLLGIKYRADWARIRMQKEHMTLKDNARENSSRIPHEYKEGDLILLEKPGIIPKLSAPRTGPHRIIRVWTNGTDSIRRGPILERVNIRRITPYHPRATANTIWEASDIV